MPQGILNDTVWFQKAFYGERRRNSKAYMACVHANHYIVPFSRSRVLHVIFAGSVTAGYPQAQGEQA
jgi:hypothetical protein